MAQGFSPSMLIYPDPVEFDYDAFIQTPEDVHFHEQETEVYERRLQPLQATLSYSSSSGPGNDTPPEPESTRKSASSNRQLVSKTPAKQRLERRGHTKSRRGCFNCKRRRIKCQEAYPACGHCVKSGLKCDYPSAPQVTHQPHHQIPIFTLQDMRFFQHFLTQCFPHQPLKQEDIWLHEVPCIAHNHDFLMHAILGYAASQLIPQDKSLVTVAMNHRVKALRAIKKRLSETAKIGINHEEANAMIATCFALTFQSVSLDDGLAEYMTFIRGIVIVGMQMMFKGIKPIFSNLMEADQDELLAPLMEGLPLIEKGWVDAASSSIIALRPLCVEPVEIEYQEKLLGIVDKLYTDSYAAYKANGASYGWWMMLSHSSFQELINPENQIVMLLHSHYIALSQIMVFISQFEYEVRQKHPDRPEEGPIDPGFIRWLRYLVSRVDYKHQIYNQWPMWVDAQLERDISFFGKTR